ncbi:MAG: helix-turn-helix transcriptional regulator [Candidatus Aenigmatarchaeota archaeon]
MKKLVLLSVLIFFLFVQPALAVKMGFLGIYVTIKEDGSVIHDTNITFINRPEYFEYNILSPIENVSVYADDKKVSCDITTAAASKITCNLSEFKPEKMQIKYTARSLVKEIDKKIIFSSDYRVPLPTNNLYVKVNLPEGHVLVKGNEDFAPCFPSDCLHASDGRKVIVIWNIHNVKIGDGLYVSATYENIGGVVTKTEMPVVLLAIPFAAIIILILITWFIYKKKLGVKMVLPVLKKDEKIIMEMLIGAKGYLNQKVLVKESGYSKAKISKILKSLEERGIVKLERIGRKNKVFLQRDFEKKGQKGSGNN